MFPVGAGLAMALFPVGYSGHSRIRFVLDGLIVAGALFEISWVLVLRSIYESGARAGSRWHCRSRIPFGDRDRDRRAAGAREGPHRPPRRWRCSVGVVFMAFADSAFAYLTAHSVYSSGHVIDIGWAAAFLTFGMAALISRTVPETEVSVPQVPSRVSMWLPYIPVAIAAMVCIPRTSRRRASGRSSCRRPC